MRDGGTARLRVLAGRRGRAMSRRRFALVGYAGAAGRIEITKVLRLDPRRYAVAEKIDGCYAHVHLGGQGRIERVFARSGEAFPRKLLGDLVGCQVGAPDSVLVGELEAWTEAANRAATARGFRVIHLFDAIRVAGRYLAREPYQDRRDALWRSQSWAENFGPGLPYQRDRRGMAHEQGSGRFCQAIPRDWRRTPIVEQLAPARAGELWERAQVGQAEGLVVTALDAPIGRRGAKRKAKPLRSIDATVVGVGRSCAQVTWAGGSFFVSCAGRQLERGQVVEVVHESFYERTGQPRFARLARARADLQRGAVP